MFVQSEFTTSKSTNNNNDLSASTRQTVEPDLENFLYHDLDLISRFCLPICSRDNEVREVALDVISKTVEGWLDGVGSPQHYRLTYVDHRIRNQRNGATNGCSCSNSTGSGNDIPKEYLELILLHLPIILRLSITCPFANVREKCKHILNVVRVSTIFFARRLLLIYPLYQ